MVAHALCKLVTPTQSTSSSIPTCVSFSTAALTLKCRLIRFQFKLANLDKVAAVLAAVPSVAGRLSRPLVLAVLLVFLGLQLPNLKESWCILADRRDTFGLAQCDFKNRIWCDRAEADVSHGGVGLVGLFRARLSRRHCDALPRQHKCLLCL
jgi:hypothetical protein